MSTTNGAVASSPKCSPALTNPFLTGTTLHLDGGGQPA
jgi:hypothetical protein